MTAATEGTLLIVDDEASVRNSLKRLLRTEGYRILSADGADSADRILDTDVVDVIVCDQDMPGRSGTDFLIDVARRFPYQRRLMLSGRFQSDDVARAMDAGAIHNFCMKPWDDSILKADIRACFRQLMTDLMRAETRADDADPSPTIQTECWSRFATNRQLTRELHSAASDGSLALNYQPQIDLTTGRVCGLEALLRWDASVGPVSPGRFISLAERGGSMTKLTHWVACEVCHRLGAWIKTWKTAKLAFNVSPLDLKDPGLIGYLEKLLTKYGVPPAALQIEITESQALSRDADTLATLDALSGLGVSLAIDDFGAGATSLSYLSELPFSSLKIDRSLTAQLDNPKGLVVVQKLLEIAKLLDMSVTIEGTETDAQVKLARDLGAHAAQGYYFSKPKNRDAIQAWIDGGASGVPE